LIFIALWIAIFKPYEVKNAPAASQVIRLEEFTFKNKDTNGSKVFLKAGGGVVKRQELLAYDIDLAFPKKKARLRAKEARMLDKILYLKGDIKFFSSRFKFFTQRARYMVKREVLLVPARFRYLSDSLEAVGSDLVYYKSIGKIVANNIKAKVYQ